MIGGAREFMRSCLDRRHPEELESQRGTIEEWTVLEHNEGHRGGARAYARETVENGGRSRAAALEPGSSGSTASRPPIGRVNAEAGGLNAGG
jgi:hypothetical protein